MFALRQGIKHNSHCLNYLFFRNNGQKQIYVSLNISHYSLHYISKNRGLTKGVLSLKSLTIHYENIISIPGQASKIKSKQPGYLYRVYVVSYCNTITTHKIFIC